MTEAVSVEVKTKSLLQKIVEIQNSVGVVKKKGRNQEQKWDYLRIEDAVVAVNKLLSERCLMLTPTLHCRADGSYFFDRNVHAGKDGPRGYIVSVILKWTLCDVETNESREWVFPGEGYDTTDKGVYKAMTGCRKYAIINIFNLPIGNDVEERGPASFEEGKEKQKRVAASKVADAAGRGNSAALDSFSQVAPEKKIIITRPEKHNGHFIEVEGYIAVPPLDKLFNDTNSKRFKRASDDVPYWRVPAEYERGLIDLCNRLEIEVG